MRRTYGKIGVCILILYGSFEEINRIMKKMARGIVLSVISLLIVSAFVYYLYMNADKYRELLHFSLPEIVILFLASLTFPLINGMQNLYMYHSLEAKISPQDSFMLAAASTLANQLPISGGVVSKSIYLKHKYNISYFMSLSSITALFFCFLSVNGVVGIITLLYQLFFKGTSLPIALFGGFFLMASSFLVFWFPTEWLKRFERLYQLTHQAVEGWMLISSDRVALLKIVVLQIGLIFLLAVRYWLAFHMLSQNVTFGNVLLFSSASILTQLVSIAPGGLGVRELIVGAVASVLGFDVGTSIVAIGLDRLISTLGIFLTGGTSTVILSRQFSGHSSQEYDKLA